MNEGSSFGWYLPISSMTLPSRFLRRVDDDDAVVRLTDLAHALQTNLDGHVCGVSLRMCVVEGRDCRWGRRGATPVGARTRG